MYKSFPLNDNTWERWASCRAIVLYDCPKCGAIKGFYCSTPKGRTTKYPHTERMNNLSKEDWDKCRVKETSTYEVLPKITKESL